MEKTVDYYMNLPYTIELEFNVFGYQASIKELPRCTVTVDASESVEELWRLLEDKQRKLITNRLERGLEVPEPPGATVDPFWEEFPDEYDQHDIRSMLYEHGVEYFPLRILEKLWLQELKDVGFYEVGPEGAPPKAETSHLDQTASALEGEVYPVRLGKSRKTAWVKFDGPRTQRGYKNIEVFDKPLRTEAAIVAALTVLEASVIEDADFKRLRDAVLAHIEAHPELRKKNLQEVLEGLPPGWFLEQWATLDEELERLKKLLVQGQRHLRKQLTHEERVAHKKLKERLPKSWRRWERFYRLWERSLRYMVALLRYRRPDFDDYPLEGQLDFVDAHRKRVGAFLTEQREHMSFLEYGTPERTPHAVERAQAQIRAAVLSDVAGLAALEIAQELRIMVDHYSYEVDSKIPEVDALVKEGRHLLNKALGKGEWQKFAKEMKDDAKRYNSLTKEEKEIEQLAESTGWPLEDARSFYRTSPGVAQFLITAPSPR